MTDEVFSFTSEQKTNLEKWETFLDTEKARGWAIEEKEAIEVIHNILKQAKFGEGNDLTPEELNSIFHQMRKLINNRSLARNLYEDNGIANFNSRLRRLLFSSESLVDRVNQFLELKRVRVLTVSHFLCAFDPSVYPEIGWQTLDVLELDSVQLDDAYKQALKEHGISSPQDYRGDTIEYLRGTVIFREIKNFLHIEDYNVINDLLWLVWLARQKEEGEMKPPPATLSLEKDLRDHLADNPNLIEKGLSLVSKEYTISGAGRADLVCKDKRGTYVVIETKKAGESDKVVGQILRYIGGLKKEGKRTRGIIIVNEPDEKLDFAIDAVKDLIKLKYYKVSFNITDSYKSS